MAGPAALAAVVPAGSPAAEGGLSPAVRPWQPPRSPKAAWDTRKDIAAWSPERRDEDALTWGQWAEGAGLLALGLTDNVLCYITYFVVREWRESGDLYSIVDLRLLLLSGIDTALLVFSAIGTAFFVSLVVFVECWKRPLFLELMTGRVYCSCIPCAVISSILLWNVENAHMSPFASLATTVLFVACWCLHVRLRFTHRLRLLSMIVVDTSWCFALMTLLGLVWLVFERQLHVLTSSDALDCPYVDNSKMPVQVLALGGAWFCAGWGGPTYVVREPVSSFTLGCDDTFVDVLNASVEVHTITCPAGCLARMSDSDTLVGCGVYTSDTALCLAAMHDGALTDAGGTTRVYGRLGLPSYQACSMNSLTSEARTVTSSDVPVTLETSISASASYVLPTVTTTTVPATRRLLTPPAVYGADGLEVPQAFHFNREHREYIHLERYDLSPSSDLGVQDDEPWTRVEATVSAEVAGLLLSSERIRLGDTQQLPLFLPREPGQLVAGQQAGECVLSDAGVLCRGSGASVLELNFCGESDAERCP